MQSHAAAGDNAQARLESDLLELIAREVRLRFALEAKDFATRLQELARAPCADGERSLRDYIARLSLDDVYLATACVRADKRAWDELAQAHFDFMRRFAARILPAPAAADVADEVIADLWTRGKLARYEGRSTLRTWLGAVVAHAALNARKSGERRGPLHGAALKGAPEAAQPSGQEHAHAQAADALRRMLDAAVRALPAEDRLLLQLYYEQGLTLDEIGAVLRVSNAAVSRRLKRVREEIRASVEALCRRSAGLSAEELRAGLDLARIEIDLGALLGCAPPAQEKERSLV